MPQEEQEIVQEQPQQSIETVQQPATEQVAQQPTAEQVVQHAENQETVANSIPPMDLKDSIKLSYEIGNFDLLDSVQANLSSKIKTIKQTVIPLIEKGLIELLGNSSAFKRREGNVKLEMKGTSFVASVALVYFVELWVGEDVDYNFILKDATYILNQIKGIPKISISKCEIDTSVGELRVVFSI